MSNSDQNKPGGKSGKRKQKRNQKPDQPQTAKPDQQQAAKDLIDAAVASTDTSRTEEVAAADMSPVDVVTTAETPPVAEVPPTDTPPVSVAAPAQADTPPVSADTSPVGLQTIASAYSDCTRKSLEDARSYVEKLSGVRSLDKAVEVQTEFAKHAYETFVADSWKIRGLYSELFKQMLKLPKLPGGRSR
jgi:Phasin protein